MIIKPSSRCNADKVPLPGEGEKKEISEFIEDVNHSLKGVYDNVRRKLNKAHQSNNQNIMRKLLAATSL